MGIELRDKRGLICGFRVQAQSGGTAVELNEIDALNPPEGLLWLHFNLNDARALDWIRSCAWLAADGRDTLLSNDRSIRFETSHDYIAGVLSDIFADDPESFGVFHIYLDRSCLLTGRRHSLASIALLHNDLLRARVMNDTSAALLNRLVGHLVATVEKTVVGHADLVDDAEDRVFIGESRKVNLGKHRRTMARLRRQVSTDRMAILELSRHPPTWWDKSEMKDIRQLSRALDAALQDLKLVEERARLLNEEISSRLSERTNRNLYFVSLAAAVFLPITLVSGIFGMNVGGLPWLGDADGFAWALLCMLAIVGVVLALMYWRRLL